MRFEEHGDPIAAAFIGETADMVQIKKRAKSKMENGENSDMGFKIEQRLKKPII